MKVTQEVLDAIFTATADGMLEDLKDPEKRTPALLTAALRMLKDNGIQAELDDPQLNKLAERVKDNVMPFSVIEAREG
jgi:hypothetical protein